ncbi:MAG: methylmalonyl-CoA epimerase [Tissierellia bacterium]|nr:methylmalonyl-CoA epimerase [Tissierellia bacterium]
MEVLRLDHIGIAVESLDDALPFWRDVLGLELAGIEVVEEQKVRVAFLPVGDTEVELLESTHEDGPISKFIERNGGPGIQHLAFRVDDIEEGIAYMKEKGMLMIDENPRYGAGGASIAFVHPKSSGRVLIELSERE